MTLIDLLIIVIIVAVSVLSIYLVKYLNNFKKTLETIERDIHLVTEKAIPVLENLEAVTKKAVQITNEAEEQISEIISFVKSIKRKVSMAVELPRVINPENRIAELLKNLNAIAKGFSVFWSKLFS